VKTNPGFDFLAPVYDLMARLVFGRAIIDSQTVCLDRIPHGAEILILGGGTGWLLEKISDQHKSCKILYVDVSKEMVKKARLRKTEDEVHFIQGTVMDIPKEIKFDVIITNFYLDLFSDKSLVPILERILEHTKTSSVWLVTDFIETTLWHRWMLKLMYLFFRIVCNIECLHLPKWKAALRANGWKEIEMQFRFNGFINTSFWVR
jgi:ubiquinone/menaquinone biosynthesis C-methylase UbiE